MSFRTIKYLIILKIAETNKMLANLLSLTSQLAVLKHAPLDRKTNLTLARNMDLFKDLPSDATPQFMAGFIYAFHDQLIDIRDDLVACYDPTTASIANRYLDAAFSSYNGGDIDSGNNLIGSSRQLMQNGDAGCDQDVQDTVSAAFSDSFTFTDRDDWEDISSDNYDANQDYVDQQWAYCLKTWNEGVYFNAGMFYGRVYNVLSVVPEN